MTKARDLANSAAAFASVSATELGYVDGVTSAIQTQMDAKAPSSTAVTLTGTQTLTNKTLTSPVIASVINNTLTSTTGDIIYASAANTPARLGIGSSAQVLTVASGIPSWAAPAGGGKVLQVVMGTYGTAISSSTFTYVDTNLTATITPSAASSKVLVFVTHTGLRKTTGSYANWPLIALLRGSTIITKLSTAEYVGEAAEVLKIGTFSVAYLDSPATTSATIYKTQFQNPANAASVTINQNSDNTSTIILMEIGA